MCVCVCLCVCVSVGAADEVPVPNLDDEAMDNRAQDLWGVNPDARTQRRLPQLRFSTLT